MNNNATEQVAGSINPVNPIEIVLSIHDPKGTYSVNAGVTMTSIFEHTSSPVRVHILHDELLTADNRAKLQRTADKYNQCVEFHNMAEYINKVGSKALELEAKGVGASSTGALFRLFIPEVIDAARVIYFDCDILVNIDIHELWKIALKDNCVAGVLNWPERVRQKFLTKNRLRCSLMGTQIQKYINSGVLVMNLDKIRALPTSMVEAAPLWFERHAHLIDFPDQDFINAFFFDSILYIPDKFNKLMIFNNYDGNAVVHMADSLKPWNSARNMPADLHYWEMYTKTAWGEGMTQVELFDVILHAVSLDPALQQPSLKARLACIVKHELYYRFKIVAIVVILLKEAFYWVKRPFCKLFNLNNWMDL